MFRLCILVITTSLLIACNTTKKVAVTKDSIAITNDSALTNTNIGIAVFDVQKNEFIHKHNANKYFIPASNTKLFTCYTALKYLPKQLIGLRYTQIKDTIHIQATGDPSFLNDEFTYQPLVNFFEKNKETVIVLHTSNWKENKWGFGWSWTDFGENYCQERSVMPLYYNTVTWKMGDGGNIKAEPPYFQNLLKGGTTIAKNSSIKKRIDENIFEVEAATTLFKTTAQPFTTDNTTLISILQRKFLGSYFLNESNRNIVFDKTITTQNIDSILKITMHRSDNFYAEQLLLMCSQELFGIMSNDSIINYIKRKDFADMPQLPRWVDGSGLSRYNMTTPESMIWLLQKMKDEFGLERLKEILPTGGEGTLSNLYKNISGNIFAKTGTLSNHAALSGFLITKSGKQLIFSSLTSGFQGSANPTRKAVEKFLLNLYETY